MSIKATKGPTRGRPASTWNHSLWNLTDGRRSGSGMPVHLSGTLHVLRLDDATVLGDLLLLGGSRVDLLPDRTFDSARLAPGFPSAWDD